MVDRDKEACFCEKFGELVVDSFGDKTLIIGVASPFGNPFDKKIGNCYSEELKFSFSVKVNVKSEALAKERQRNVKGNPSLSKKLQNESFLSK